MAQRIRILFRNMHERLFRTFGRREEEGEGENLSPSREQKRTEEEKRERQVSHKGRREKWPVDFFPRGEIARAGKVKVARAKN